MKLSTVRGQVRPIELPATVLPQVRALVPRVLFLVLAATALSLLVLGVQALSFLLGIGGPRSYLLLAQNRDELRATGGFISAAGLLTVENGRVTSLTLRDSYAIDNFSVPHPEPPAPLLRHMSIGTLLLRDANWWPDFPTSARMALSIWQADQGARPDGVIALDQDGLRLLLEAMGPLRLPDGALLSGESLDATLEAAWSPQPGQSKEEWWPQRKDFMSTIAQAALHRIENAPSLDMLKGLWGAARQAGRHKHLLVYVKDEQIARLVRLLGLDGRLGQTAGDYLLVVDSNVGYNKVNGLIRQEISYRVSLTETGALPLAHLDITYRHSGQGTLPACVHEARYGEDYGDLKERCYWDYLRVYAPAGAMPLLDEQAAPQDVVREGDKLSLGSLLVVGPGEERSARFTYTLPRGILEQQGRQRRYRLLVQKQAGAAGHPLSVTVALPAGARLLSASPPPAALSGNSLSFTAVLVTDLTFEVLYEE